MIINGGCRSGGGWFSKHLVNTEKNERVKIVDMRGISAETVAGCFQEMKAVASGTRCKNYFYHANINIHHYEHLTPDQWEKAVDTLEKNLGLEGQARFVVEHEKTGRTHQHVIWSRIDVENMTAIRMSKDFVQHQITSRELEKEFNLEKGVSVLGPEKEGPRPERRPEQWEVFRGKENGIDPQKMKMEITELWNKAGSGKEFATDLDNHGYVLARGDRRNFCIVDSEGDVHSLARRIKGAKAADVRARLADIDSKALPNIKQAQEYQRGRNPQQEKGHIMLDTQQQEEQVRAAITREEEQRQELIQKDEDHRQQAIKDEDERVQQVIKEQEQQKEEQQKAAERKEEQRLEQFKEQNDRLSEQAKELEQAQRYLDTYKAELEQEAEKSKRQEAEREASAKEGEFNNAGYRYGQALGKHYDIRDPYGSLARSSMAEYGAFLQERQNLDRQIARANDPETRQALELRKQIEAAEYMEITSNRIATQSEIIGGRSNTPEALKERARAAAFHKEAQALRKEYRELHIARTQGERGSTGGGQQHNDLSGHGSGKPQRVQPPLEQGKGVAQGTEREQSLEEICEKWKGANSGKEFADALKERGYVLARDERGQYDFTVKEDGGARTAAVAKNGYAYRLDPERMQCEPKDFAQRMKEIQSGERLPNLDEVRTMRAQLGQEQPQNIAPALMVEERAAGKPPGEQQNLSDYVKTLPEKPAPREFTKEQIRNDPAAKREHYSQLRDEQNRKVALDHIGQDLRGNKNLNAKDIRHLSGDDLKNIKTKGDDHLKTLIQQQERQREKGRER